MNRKGVSLISGFLESVERCPSRPALEVEGRSFTYRELLDAASSLAAALDTHSTGPEPPLTAVFASRTPTAFFGAVAALLRGHGYVPLNRAYPPTERPTCHCSGLPLHDRRCRVVAAAPRRAGRRRSAHYPRSRPRIGRRASGGAPRGTACSERPTCAGRGEPYAEPDPESIAYLIFTSGSTGAPKGVMRGPPEHLRAPRFSRRAVRRHGERPPFADVRHHLRSFRARHVPLVGRRRVLLLPSQKALLNPGSFIRKHRITVWNSVPSTALFMKRLGSLKENNFPSLHLEFGGEPLPETVVRDWIEAAPFRDRESLRADGARDRRNVLPVGGTAAEPRQCYRGTVPIGRPVPGLTALVRRESGRSLRRGGRAPHGRRSGHARLLKDAEDAPRVRRAPRQERNLLPHGRPREEAGAAASRSTTSDASISS